MRNVSGSSKHITAAVAVGLLAVVGIGLAVYFWPGAKEVPEPLPRTTRREPRPASTLRVKEIPRRDPTLWAVVIGIDQYPDDAIPPCHGAVADARAVADWIETTAGWGKEHVLLLDGLGDRQPDATDQSSSWRPTRENLDRAVRTWLAERVEPEDTVVVYYAGQSVHVPPPPDAPPVTPGRAYLLPIDARLASAERTGWALDEALDELASKEALTIVCWLDTSLMGAAGRSARPRTTRRPAPGSCSG